MQVSWNNSITIKGAKPIGEHKHLQPRRMKIPAASIDQLALDSQSSSQSCLHFSFFFFERNAFCFLKKEREAHFCLPQEVIRIHKKHPSPVVPSPDDAFSSPPSSFVSEKIPL